MPCRPDASFSVDSRRHYGYCRRLHDCPLFSDLCSRAHGYVHRSDYGAATALFAATIGLAQNDIKKVLAYSTISQLGYMFLACGVGAFAAAIFHVHYPRVF